MARTTSLDALATTPHAEVFEEPRTVRLHLASGDRVPPHTHPGMDIVCHVVSGELELSLDDETHTLAGGDLARFSGDREISPRAREETVALLVFA